MVYRKAPSRPTKLLLRIVAAAGTGALMNVGCGGQIDQPCTGDHVCGSLPSNCYTDAGDVCHEDAGGGFIDAGLVVGFADASDPCVDDAGNPICGLLPTTVDGGADE